MKTYDMADSFFASVYFIFITITTVGYGDNAPETVVGRIVVMCSTIFGAVLTSLMVMVSNQYLELNQNEMLAFRKIRTAMQAKKVIVKAFHYYRIKKLFYIKKI